MYNSRSIALTDQAFLWLDPVSWRRANRKRMIHDKIRSFSSCCEVLCNCDFFLKYYSLPAVCDETLLLLLLRFHYVVISDKMHTFSDYTYNSRLINAVIKSPYFHPSSPLCHMIPSYSHLPHRSTKSYESGMTAHEVC